MPSVQLTQERQARNTGPFFSPESENETKWKLKPCILSFLSLVYWPFRTRLVACLIGAAILYFSCHLHLFTSRCFVIGSPD